jgi:hypothetical protein
MGQAATQADLFDSLTDTADTSAPTEKPDELNADIARLDAAWDTFLTARIPRLVTDARTQFDQHTAAVAAWERKGRTARGRASRGDKPTVWWDWLRSADALAVAWASREAAELTVARLGDASPYLSIGEVADALTYAGIDLDGTLGSPSLFGELFAAYRLEIYRTFENAGSA